jgi:hypothetical protein
MRASTATIILAFCSMLATYAAPAPVGGGLAVREASMGDVLDGKSYPGRRTRGGRLGGEGGEVGDGTSFHRSKANIFPEREKERKERERVKGRRPRARSAKPTPET